MHFTLPNTVKAPSDSLMTLHLPFKSSSRLVRPAHVFRAARDTHKPPFHAHSEANT